MVLWSVTAIGSDGHDPAGWPGTNGSHLELRISPNPFRAGTEIQFDLLRPARAELVVSDVQGRVVRRLGGAELPAGRNALLWDGDTADGASAHTGIYFLALRTDGMTAHSGERVVRLR